LIVTLVRRTLNVAIAIRMDGEGLALPLDIVFFHIARPTICFWSRRQRQIAAADERWSHAVHPR